MRAPGKRKEVQGMAKIKIKIRKLDKIETTHQTGTHNS
jgi:hypothetical protein